jgi:sugar phosphate isomerase/epimerase
MQNTISIASYSFHGLLARGAMSIFQYFETVKYRYGLTTADIWNGMLTGYDEGYLRLVKQMMDEHGLRLVNLCCDGCHLLSDDPEETKKLDAVADDCFRAAEILGAETIRMDWGVRAKTATDAQIEAAARKYDEYCRRAARIGAKLGPENHWGASTNVTELKKLFQAVKAENFGLLLHMGNWQESADTGEAAILQNDAAFAGKAMHTHIAYEVCLDAERRLQPLIDGGYAHSYSVESHKATNEYNNVLQQLGQVKRVAARVDYGK